MYINSISNFGIDKCICGNTYFIIGDSGLWTTKEKFYIDIKTNSSYHEDHTWKCFNCGSIYFWIFIKI